MADWQTRTLGEVLIKTETINPAMTPEEEFDYIDVSSVSNAKYAIEVTQRLKGRGAPSRARRRVHAGDVIFATVRPTLKRIAVIPPEMDGQVCSTGYFVLRPCSDIDHRFLFYYLFTAQFLGAMESLQKGASYPAVTDAEVRAQPISFPRIQEQRRIVAILDEAFEGIATAKANAEKNLQNARELFARQLQARLSEPRPSWFASTLGATYDVRDGTHDSPKYHDRGRPLITSKNLRPEGLSFDDVKFIADTDYRKINERSAVHKGDVLFAMIGTIGNPTVVEVEPDFAIKNVALFKIPKGQSGHYLRYYLSSQGVVSKMQSEAKGTTQKFVGLGYLRAFPVTVPPPVEQVALVQELDDLAAETGRLEGIYEQKLAALDELKKSLLHRAFTGALTEKFADKQVAEVA